MRAAFLVVFALSLLVAAGSAVIQWGDARLPLPWHILLTVMFGGAAALAASGLIASWRER